MNNFKDQKVAIFGFARSGVAAAEKLLSAGARVLVTERAGEEKFAAGSVEALRRRGVDFEFGGHRDRILESDMIVVSPGVRLDIPVIDRAKAIGIPVISEIELAYRFLSRPIIAVTGTNGKTTTTSLIGEILKSGGKKVAVAGNIGFPLVAVDDIDLDYVVAEISSYQLETIDQFKPWISVILNITSDHLERYHSMETYAAAKARIFRNQGRSDYLVYNDDDAWTRQIAPSATATRVPFSRKRILNRGIFVERTILCSAIKRREVIGAMSDIKIPGLHNLENALSAITVGMLCGIPSSRIMLALKTFPGVEHRIEFVAEVGGVTFINDSKGTNPDSTIVALNTFALDKKKKQIILIAGGRDKGIPLRSLAETVGRTVKTAVLIGEAAPRFSQELGDKVPTVVETTFEGAVKKALSLAVPGDIVLLSPACASFDMFANFEERGAAFKRIVGEL